MRIMLEEGARMPTVAHAGDAGMDLYAREDAEILPGEAYTFDTGVHIELPEGTYGKLESKSGLNVNYNVVSLGGVIDHGYTGSIRVKQYNFGREPYRFLAGEKIVQMIVVPFVDPELEPVESLGSTERGENGFGSSGK